MNICTQAQSAIFKSLSDETAPRVIIVFSEKSASVYKEVVSLLLDLYSKRQIAQPIFNFPTSGKLALTGNKKGHELYLHEFHVFDKECEANFSGFENATVLRD